MGAGGGRASHGILARGRTEERECMGGESQEEEEEEDKGEDVVLRGRRIG